MAKEEDYPSPKTFQSACDWLDDNKGKDDFFLMVEAFDPHEPFDVVDKYMEMYEHAPLDKEYFEIPQYDLVDVPDNAVDYIEKRYAALLTMSDAWFGKFIQHLKDVNMFDDTLIIMTTDHGYFLGERNYLGKNYMHLYNELAHLPCIVKFPHDEYKGQRIAEITQNIDIMPTVLDFCQLPIPNSVRGVSWRGLLNGTYHKEYALYGYHGMALNITDGRYTYFRAPNEQNQPCFEYTCIPTTIRKYLGEGNESQIEMGRFIQRTDYPVFKIPVVSPSIIDNVPFGIREVRETKLFDLQNDYAQKHNLVNIDKVNEARMKELLLRALDENDAPSEQKQRVDLI